MSELTSKAVMAVNKLSIDNDTRADTSSKRYHKKVFQAFSHTVGHLAKGGSICIVSQHHVDAEALAEHSSKRDRLSLCPCYVWRVLNHSSMIIAVRCSCTHTVNTAYTTNLLNYWL